MQHFLSNQNIMNSCSIIIQSLRRKALLFLVNCLFLKMNVLIISMGLRCKRNLLMLAKRWLVGKRVLGRVVLSWLIWGYLLLISRLIMIIILVSMLWIRIWLWVLPNLFILKVLPRFNKVLNKCHEHYLRWVTNLFISKQLKKEKVKIVVKVKEGKKKIK